MVQFKIRRAPKGDSAGFLALMTRFARFVHMTPPDAAARRRILRDVFSRKRINLLVALVGTKHVGYALYYYTYSSFLGRPTLYLEDLFVLEEFRSKGVGNALFRACAKEAVRQGCRRMEWSVLKWNRGAILYYEKLGAKRLEELLYYRLTADRLNQLSSKRSRGAC